MFLGKYNANVDKSAEDCFGFSGEDESWEIKNNTGDRVLWKSDDYRIGISYFSAMRLIAVKRLVKFFSVSIFSSL